MNYAIRSAAMRAAKSRGWEHFRTVRHPIDKTWSAKQTHSTKQVDFSFANGKDFVAWCELHLDANNNPHPVLVVSCTKEELVEENIPSCFMIEPQTDDLFENEIVIKPSVKVTRAKSDIVSPTKLVWEIADSMLFSKRSEIIEACIARGVNPATASTQFSKWKKAKG